MKNILNIIAFASLSIFITSCWGDDFEYSYNYNDVKPAVQEFKGPAVVSGNNVTEYTFSAFPRAGSTFQFSITGAEATITPVADAPHKVTVVFKDTPTELAAEVQVIETAMNGNSSDPETMDVTVQAYCPYDFTDLVLSYAGTDERNSDSFASQVVISDLGTSPVFGITGLAFQWMVDYWGESIENSEVVDVEIDDLGISLTIPEQYYMTTLWEGDPYDYSISGSGTINSCTGEITINYILTNTTDGYDIENFVATLSRP